MLTSFVTLYLFMLGDHNICPKGFERRDDLCVVVQLKPGNCPPYTVYSDELKKCIHFHYHYNDMCPAGYHKENGICVIERSGVDCPPYTLYSDVLGKCIHIHDHTDHDKTTKEKKKIEDHDRKPEEHDNHPHMDHPKHEDRTKQPKHEDHIDLVQHEDHTERVDYRVNTDHGDRFYGTDRVHIENPHYYGRDDDHDNFNNHIHTEHLYYNDHPRNIQGDRVIYDQPGLIKFW